MEKNNLPNSDKKTILVTGCNGQLGKEIQKVSILFTQYNFLFTSRTTLPIENLGMVQKYFQETQIDYCINCAAYTSVDKAESEKEMAFLINAEAAGNLAMVCKNHHAQLIHISTDYVFTGSGRTPFKEDSIIGPRNIYGASKLRGEELVLNNLPTSLIIRTSWVYSSFGNNFVKTIIRLMDQKENINVVNDQYGSPTYAADLADVILKFIEFPGNARGIFNYSNQGITTWYEFANTIKKLIKSNCNINPVTTVQFPTPAARPEFSSLDTSKIVTLLNINIPTWLNGLERCISILL